VSGRHEAVFYTFAFFAPRFEEQIGHFSSNSTPGNDLVDQFPAVGAVVVSAYNGYANFRTKGTDPVVSNSS